MPLKWAQHWCLLRQPHLSSVPRTWFRVPVSSYFEQGWYSGPERTHSHTHPPTLQWAYFTNRKQETWFDKGFFFFFCWLVNWFFSVKNPARVETSDPICFPLQWIHFIEKEKKYMSRNIILVLCVSFCVCIRYLSIETFLVKTALNI